MKALITYESVYGNTEKIAAVIAGVLKASHDVKVIRSTEVNLSDLDSLDLLIIGSPTQWNKPLPAVQNFPDRMKSRLKGLKTVLFDTRLTSKLVGIFGYAANKMAGSLKKKGAQVLAMNGFYVGGGGIGPLKEGELERAAGWIKEILERIK